MDYEYRIDTVIPKSEFMSVTYMADGYPDFRRNFNPRSFTEDALRELIEGYAENVVDFWLRIDEHPEDAPAVTGRASADPPVYAPFPPPMPVREPMPDIDVFTQRCEPAMIEDIMQETVGWDIYDLTEEEQAEFLSNWRNGFAVSMAQFRLALFERGIMEAEMSISSADPKLRILWESSNFVRRNSEQVAKVLSMTDEELDEFFKFASTLEDSV